MISSTVEIKLDDFEGIENRIAAALDDLLQEAGEVGKEELDHSVRVRTGYTQSRNAFVKHSPLNYELKNDAPWAGYLNFGTARISADHFFDRGTQAVIQAIITKAQSFESRIR